MLQLNSQAAQAAQAALAQSGDGRLGGGVREAAELPAVPSAGQLPPAGAAGDFAALQAATLEALEPLESLEPVAAQEAVEQLAADETSAQAVDVEQAPQPAASVAAPAEPIAEQWLLGMLGQRAIQVEARDGDEVGRAPDDAQAPALVSLPMAAPRGLSREAGSLGQRSSEQIDVRNGGETVRDSLAPVRPSLPVAAMQGAREAALSPDAEVVGTVLAQAPANMANPPSEAAAPPDSRSVGQLQRSSGQAAALSVAAGQAAANPSKILGEAAAPQVAGPEPLDGQLLAQLERLSGQTAAAPAEAGTASAGPGQTAQAPGLERTLKLQAPEVKWGEQMLHALRESVELQLQQRVQHTSIRLDPPELGSLEIFLSHESGRLSVQISAAQGDVARLLQQTSERLRQELVGQNFLQVSVQVSADGQPSQQHERQGRARLFDEEPVMAGSLDAEQPERGAASRSGDVLITV
jgi:flagellar hook-length control protein FliK